MSCFKESPTNPGQQPGLSVLVVDDEELVRAALLRSFRRVGCEVVGAGSLDEARAIVSRGGIELAVVDLRLGFESGLELIGELSTAVPPIEVIVATGLVVLEAAALAIRLGALTVLEKPVDAPRILAALERARRLPTDLDFALGGAEVVSRDTADLGHVRRVLDGCGGNVAQAARELGISRSTMYRLIDRLK